MNQIGSHFQMPGIGLKTITKLFLILLLSQMSIADEIFIEEPSFDTLDSFLDDEINFSSVDTLSEVLNTDEQKFKKYRPKEFIRKGPQAPKKHYAVLQEGSPLHEINGEKVISNNEKLFVNAREVYYGGKWSYIYNKSGEIKFKTLTTNLSYVEEVVKLWPSVPGNKVYERKSHYHSVDKEIPMEGHLVFKSETMDFKALNILSNETLDQSTSSSISLKGYFNSFLPIDFGMALDYQSGEAESSSDSVVWSALYIGPTIKYNFYKIQNFSFNTQFAVKKSLLFNASSELGNLSLSSLVWQIGIEGAYKTKYGSISLGLDSSVVRTSVKGEFGEQLSFQSTKESMRQNAITVGYQYSWML